MTDTLQDVETRIAADEAAVMRYEIALSKGVPSDRIAELTGTTREELEAQADELVQPEPGAGDLALAIRRRVRGHGGDDAGLAPAIRRQVRGR